MPKIIVKIFFLNFKKILKTDYVKKISVDPTKRPYEKFVGFKQS